MIDVKNVSFTYGNETILDNISFHVKSHTYTLLIGANGSGKSTLLKGILGLKKQSSGTICLFGVENEKFTNWDKIGYVAQHAAFIDMSIPLSVKEAVSMGKTGRVSEQEIRTVLREVDMESFIHNDVNKLSGGQQQRVFIARSLLTNPELLILDEPTVGLDAKSTDNFYQLLAQLHHKGQAILLVTHDTHFMTDAATHVIELSDKRIAFDGISDAYSKWHKQRCHRDDTECLVQRTERKKGQVK